MIQLSILIEMIEQKRGPEKIPVTTTFTPINPFTTTINPIPIESTAILRTVTPSVTSTTHPVEINHVVRGIITSIIPLNKWDLMIVKRLTTHMVNPAHIIFTLISTGFAEIRTILAPLNPVHLREIFNWKLQSLLLKFRINYNVSDTELSHLMTQDIANSATVPREIMEMFKNPCCD